MSWQKDDYTPIAENKNTIPRAKGFKTQGSNL